LHETATTSTTTRVTSGVARCAHIARSFARGLLLPEAGLGALHLLLLVRHVLVVHPVLTDLTSHIHEAATRRAACWRHRYRIFLKRLLLPHEWLRGRQLCGYTLLSH
jgi:hypothetical protein